MMDAWEPTPGPTCCVGSCCGPGSYCCGHQDNVHEHDDEQEEADYAAFLADREQYSAGSGPYSKEVMS